ncbi:MAG: hypothetical protein EOP49_29700 [Sphingobacteriales bacterium]|nr:MAG: hypothetical protein EOP49_29700 [Sphingobacteriales bacterium]
MLQVKPVATLMIHGEGDDRIPVAHAQRLSSWLQIRGVEQRLVSIPGADHHLDAYRQEYHDILIGEVAAWCYKFQ